MASVVDDAWNKTRRRFGRWPSHTLDQPSQHKANLVETCVKNIVLPLCEKAEVASQEKEVFQLARGTRGYVQELAEFRPASSSASLCYVGGNRERSSPHLVADAVPLIFREGGRSAVDSHNKRVALLPNLELLEILHRVTAHKASCIYLQLITNNCRPCWGGPC